MGAEFTNRLQCWVRVWGLRPQDSLGRVEWTYLPVLRSRRREEPREQALHVAEGRKGLALGFVCALVLFGGHTRWHSGITAGSLGDHMGVPGIQLGSGEGKTSALPYCSHLSGPNDFPLARSGQAQRR